MPRKLKVFRTSTGFHDAYVAAPSRKAALAAWGAEADLFARGVAEEVRDPKLTKAPLERPGEVIRISRGDLSAQLKALGPRKKPPGQPRATIAKPRRPEKPRPPPSRDRIDAAEEALIEARRRHAAEAGKLEAAREAIERELAGLRAKQDREVGKLERRRDEAREAYRKALARWSA